jgi:hypothetical protein
MSALSRVLFKHSGAHLAVVLALTLGACGAEPATDDDNGSAGADDDVADDDVGDDDVADDDVTEDDDTTPPGDDDGDDDSKPPPPPADTGTGPKPTNDGGMMGSRDASASTDAGARDTGTPARDAGADPAPSDAGTDPGGGGKGECCDDGKCICRAAPPSSASNMRGPYQTMSFNVAGTGCVYYPTNADAPFAAVSISDGFGGTGGCGRTQTDGWGPLYASWGIVTMIVNTGSGDQPNARGRALIKGIEAFKAENMRSGSPLMGKMAGRYGTSGFSMGGGGTSYASVTDKTLLTSVAIMPWQPVRSGVTVPTLIICGSSDGIASCASHGNPLYSGIQGMTPKMKVTVQSGHVGQPTAGSGRSGAAGLAFQKVYLEGDTRWKPLLQGIMGEKANIN